MQQRKADLSVEVSLDAEYMSFEEFSRIIDSGQLSVKCQTTKVDKKQFPASEQL
ncbi:hypothetical protein [Vibrio crassostreae]|uniref:hypothetical protein n=1 Tax=Vibrio crassostreae TaxID=246167 RepID=UPI001B30F882|nr:hypothetical protein [Vibrio crassostreae]